MSNPTLTKNYTAGGTIGPNLIVKWGAGDYIVLQSAAVTDRHCGVSRGAGQTANSIATLVNEQIDIVVKGEYEIYAGGTIARGDPLTSNASGQAVTAAPAAGTNNPIVGYAKVAAVSGDLFLADINPQTFQG